MFLRINRLPVELPMSPEIDPVAARNVQELLGGRFGEMSTLMNYTFQSLTKSSRSTPSFPTSLPKKAATLRSSALPSIRC